MQNSGRLWILMARCLNGEATLEEKRELDCLLSQDDSLGHKYELLGHLWFERSSKHSEVDHSADKIVSKIITLAELERIHSEMQLDEDFPRKKRFFSKLPVLIGSIAAVIIFAGILIWRYNNASKSTLKSEQTIAAQYGSRSRSMLPDGSTVWLNAGSKLFYDDFNGATREVRLEGEAFFDVVKQPNHPFIVHTSGIDIKVLGTSFNVKSYPEDKTVETTLYRGSVKVFRHEESERGAIQLKPNEKLILYKQAAVAPGNLSEKTKAAPSTKVISEGSTIAHIDSTKKENERIETAWVYNRLEFRGDNFEELARKLERWYNVTITFTDDEVKQLSFNGSFEGETVEQAFKYLRETQNEQFNYRISNHEIFVGSSQ